jgi:GINS complex subunit 3
MNALKADPRTVDLRSLAPNYYRLSERVLELFEEEEMVDILSNVCLTPPTAAHRSTLLTHPNKTFKKRAAEIADHAHNPKGALGDGVEFLRGLDETERQCSFTHVSEPASRWPAKHISSVPRGSR